MRARSPATSPRRPHASAACLYSRRVRLRHLRRRARAAAPVGPVAPARGHDDDPGGVGEPRPDGSRPPRVLRVPLDVDGAVGRPRGDDVHGRDADRLGAGPQRPAPRPVLGHRGRPGRVRVGGRRPDIDPATIVAKGRLEPGRMFLVDTGKGRIIDDQEIKSTLAAQKPYAEWVRRQLRLPRAASRPAEGNVHALRCEPVEPLRRRQRTFGYTGRSWRILMTPDGARRARGHRADGERLPVGDAVRAGRRCSTTTSRNVRPGHQPTAGRHPRGDDHRDRQDDRQPKPNLLEDESPEQRRLEPAILPIPADRQRPARQDRARGQGAVARLPSTLSEASTSVSGGGQGARGAPRGDSSPRLDAAVADGVSFIAPSDRNSDADLAPIPSLLLLSAVHHHTLRRHTRTMISLVVEAGDVREVHHTALLIGYGAAAVNPYLAPWRPSRTSPVRGTCRVSTRRRPSPTSSRRSARAS